MIFAAVFAVNFLVVLVVYGIRYPLSLPAGIGLACLCLYISRRAAPEKQFRFFTGRRLIYITAALFCLMTALQIWIGWTLRITPTSDRGIIFQQAAAIADSGVWRTDERWNFYFLRYPNNRFLLLLEALYFSMLKNMGITDYLFANIILNIALIDLSVFLLLHLAVKLWGEKAGLPFMTACLGFVPFYLYAPFVYTDSFVMPVVTGIAYLFYEASFRSYPGHRRRQLVRFLAIGALSWVGFSLKATAAILLIAIILYFVCTNLRKNLIGIMAALCICFVMQGGYAAWMDRAQIFDETNYRTENFPYTHWVMMGLKGLGKYNVEDRKYTSSFHTVQDKKKANFEKIQERLTAYGAAGLTWHQIAKNAYTWSNGMYDMEFYLNKEPIETNALQEVVFSGRKYLTALKIYTEGYHLAMMGFVLASILAGIRHRRMDFLSVLKLAVFGLILFLSIWETRPRYLMHYVPLLFLICADGQLWLARWLKCVKR